MCCEKGKLDGRVALVTGGARGIGKAICEKLASEGARLALIDILLEVAEETAEEFRRNGVEAAAFQADVSSPSDADKTVKAVLDKFGRVDILINNAGITKDTLIMRMSEDQWDAVINVNLKGSFNFIKAVSRPMMKAKHGKIVNVSSVVGRMGNAGQANYSASKAGLIGLTKSAAKEFATRSINVNAVAPGYIMTEMTENLPDEAKNAFMSVVPMKRAGTPEDVAGVVSFLCGSDSDYLTGQVINVDGGLLM